MEPAVSHRSEVVVHRGHQHVPIERHEQCSTNAWVDEVGPASPSEGPIAKPDVASLRGFLAQCLGVSGEGDARSSGRAADASSDIPVVKPTDKGSNKLL